MIRNLVIRTRAWPVLRPLYRLAYESAARASVIAIRAVLGFELEAVYLRRGMTERSWQPGVSDVDLLAVVSPRALETADAGGLWGAHDACKTLFPMLGELQACTRAQLEEYARAGGLRAAELGRWRPLFGAPPPSAGAGGPRACLQESAFAYLCLLDALAAWSRGRAFERFTAAKAFLDCVRCARAAEAGVDLPDGRLEELGELRPRNEARLVACLEDPDRLDAETAFKLVHVALGVLDAACARLCAAAPAASRARARPEDAGDETWARRLHALGGPGMPEGAGVLHDAWRRTYVALPAKPQPAALERLLEETRGWGADAAPWLVTYPILAALCASPHLETPFLRAALGPAGAAFWRAPSWRGQARWRWNVDVERLAPLDAGRQRALARQTAAELALTLPQYAQPGFGGPREYRLFHAASRVAALAAFARDGRVPDPGDLDALLAGEPALARAFAAALEQPRADTSFETLWPAAAEALARAQRELAA